MGVTEGSGMRLKGLVDCECGSEECQGEILCDELDDVNDIALAGDKEGCRNETIEECRTRSLARA